MIIYHDPDQFKVVVEHSTCHFHEEHPGRFFAGCTCKGSYSLIRKSPIDGTRKDSPG